MNDPTRTTLVCPRGHGPMGRVDAPAGEATARLECLTCLSAGRVPAVLFVPPAVRRHMAGIPVRRDRKRCADPGTHPAHRWQAAEGPCPVSSLDGRECWLTAPHAGQHNLGEVFWNGPDDTVPAAPIPFGCPGVLPAVMRAQWLGDALVAALLVVDTRMAQQRAVSTVVATADLGGGKSAAMAGAR